MGEAFTVSILSPEGAVFEGEAVSLVAPAATGYVGILAHHAPFIATLARGTITVRDGSGKAAKFDCRDGGFLEVSQNRAALILGHR